MQKVLENLLSSEEPAIRLKALTNILGKDINSSECSDVQDEIKTCSRVKLLLSERNEKGEIPFHPYKKWYGAHWVLTSLADIGYPPGDVSLIPLREQVHNWLFSQQHEKKIKSIAGRVRRCASQEGNAIFCSLSLDLADDRTEELVNRLHHWQWPDGGWNCDKNPKAIHSSFMESLIPLRALALHTKKTNNSLSLAVTKSVAEIFLKRELFKKLSDGYVIKDDFVKLHYPCYWHYDILFGLKVLTEAGFVKDPRCQDALKLLLSKRLPDGGWPAEKKYYQVTNTLKSGRSLVNWQGTGKSRMNEFITVDALWVLKEGDLVNIEY